MSITNYKAFAEAAYKTGKSHWQAFSYLCQPTKQYRWGSTFSSQNASALISNIPRAYYGTPGSFVPVTGGTFQDVYLGPVPAAGETKLLASVTLANSFFFNPVLSEMNFLVDILGYYPQVDATVAGQINFTNSLPLPDYVSGDGVQAFIVGLAGVTGNAVSCSATYTNQSGVGNRVSNFFIQSSGNSDEVVAGVFLNQSGSYGIGSVTNSPFLPLQSGDRGIRSIESITIGASCQARVNVVLCKPIVSSPLVVTSIAARYGLIQFDILSSAGLPSLIRNNACIHMLTTSNNTSSTTRNIQSRGFFEFIWG